MITPKDMDKFTNNEVVKMYEKLNQDLTRTIISKLRGAGDISSYTRSQIATLKRTGGAEIFKKALFKTNTLTKREKKQIEALFDEIGRKSLEGYEETFKKKNISDEVTPELITGLVVGISTSNKELKKIKKKIAIGAKNKFASAVDEAYRDVMSGRYDYTSAIKKAVRTLADEGVTLKTKDGRNEKLDVAVKRRLHDAIHSTANDMAEKVGKAIGYNCVYIGHSSKCRPSHHVIDGVVMSKDEFKKYEYLTEEYNCNHIVNYDWREEFEDKRLKRQYTDEHKSYAETVRNYNKLQKANYYARQVRAKKSNIASGDNTNKAKLQLKLAQMKYRKYCLKNGLDVDYDKTWTVGYNK